jgi:hypothetical protein
VRRDEVLALDDPIDGGRVRIVVRFTATSACRRFGDGLSAGS